MIEGEYGLGVFRMRAQRRCVRGPAGAWASLSHVSGSTISEIRRSASSTSKQGVPLTKPSVWRLLKIRVTRGQSTPMARSSSVCAKTSVWLALQRDFAMVEHEHAVAVL